jgi:hypothetical protein
LVSNDAAQKRAGRRVRDVDASAPAAPLRCATRCPLPPRCLLPERAAHPLLLLPPVVACSPHSFESIPPWWIPFRLSAERSALHCATAAAALSAGERTLTRSVVVCLCDTCDPPLHLLLLLLPTARCCSCCVWLLVLLLLVRAGCCSPASSLE